MTNLLDVWRGARNPFREFHKLQRTMDRLLDNFIEKEYGNGGRWLESFSPPCDLEETESFYQISFDVPGVPKECIKVEIADNALVVSGERREEKIEDTKARHHVERFHGKFQRIFTLPPGTSTDKIEANYQDGVIKVSIPKTESAKRREIKIGDTKQATSVPFNKIKAQCAA